MFKDAKRKNKTGDKKKKKLDKYYSRYFQRYENVNIIKNFTQSPVTLVPSVTVNIDSYSDDTLRNVSSIPWSMGLTPLEKVEEDEEHTDRQLANLFSPSDYQKLLDEDVDNEEAKYKKLEPFPRDSLEYTAIRLKKTHSYEMPKIDTEKCNMECNSEPGYHSHHHLNYNLSCRMTKLEKEVENLKQLVNDQSKQLMDARFEINSLMLEYKTKEDFDCQTKRYIR